MLSQGLLIEFSVSQAVGLRAWIPSQLLLKASITFLPLRFYIGRFRRLQLTLSGQARKGSNQTEVTIFCSLVSEMVSIHFSRIVFIGSKSTLKGRFLKGISPWVGKFPWRKEGPSILVFLPRKFQGKGSLEGYSWWGCKELDMTDWLTLLQLYYCSVTQSCPTFCDLMNCSTPVFPCLSPSPRVYSNTCPLSRWCHLTISPSVGPFFSCPQSFPASGSFLKSKVFSNESALPFRWPKY